MTPDQISKLPPELQRAAELCEKPSNEVTFSERQEITVALNAALTYCLQMQEERDALQSKLDEMGDVDYVLNVDRTWKAKNREIDAAKDRAETAEATIATLTRERNKAQDLLADSISREDDVRKELSFARKKFAALSHTPEGKS